MRTGIGHGGGSGYSSRPVGSDHNGFHCEVLILLPSP